MSEARGLFEYQQDATEAKKGRRTPVHLRLAEEPAPLVAAPKWTREATRLELLGWEYRVRMGKRIWKKPCETTVGGHLGWYGEEMAIEMQRRIDERKGS